MGNPNGVKGAAFERAVVAYLRDHGFPHADRAYGAGRNDDRGDIDGFPGVVWELKNHARFDLATWMDEVRGEQANAHAQYGVVVAKRRQHPIGRAYVICELEQFTRLLFEREQLA